MRVLSDSMKLFLAFVLVLLGCLQSSSATEFRAQALLEMKMRLNDNCGVLNDWKDTQTSPCYWDHVTCQDNNVVTINLSSSGLAGVLSPSIAKLTTLQQLLLDNNSITGGIPQEFGNLTSLTTLNLGRNNLNGSIPDSLGRLLKLQILDLSQNQLRGSIPTSFLNLSSLNNINLAYNNLSGEIPQYLLRVPRYKYIGNHFNCDQQLFSCEGGSTKTGGSKNSRLKVVLGSIAGAVTLLVIGVLFVLWWQRMRYRPEIFIHVPAQNDHKLEFGQIKRFSWRELHIATNNFSEQNVLGKGGFGTVYKGVLPGPDSIKIAVKRLFDVQSPDGELTFLREVELISIAVHKNILRLIGFCTTPTERLLVYPFMENLSVASRLRDIKLNEPALDWSTRMRIALGAARGLEYLHEHCNPKIIHRDVKAANVLLDGNFEAVVGDFGLAKTMDIGRNTVTTGVRGTMGHIAPEYIKTGRPSVKTDIFGYGVTLLEIVTGERAIAFYPEAGEMVLTDRVKLWMEEGKLQVIVDRNLGALYNLEELQMIIQIALRCTNMEPDHRPAMSEVVQMLERELVPADYFKGQKDRHRLEFRHIKVFTFLELQIATNNFSEQNVLGKGGYGKVYEGVLPVPGRGRTKIAVKRMLNVKSPDTEQSFLREVDSISIATHNNVLSLIGFCTTQTERLLVYPFMENGSVASRLRDIKLNERALDWSTRMRIALGTARGLEYLHEHCKPKIIHRDVKAENVLLGRNFEAVVGDFGLAKLDTGRNTVTVSLRGTPGHIAPEYANTWIPTVKTDIYGFGVTLLEIVTGQRAIALFPGRTEESENIILSDQVKQLMLEGQVHTIVDHNLGDLYKHEEMEKIIKIALLCTHMQPDHRPAMSEVVQMLEGKVVPAERWEEWQMAELSRRQQYETRQQRKPFSFSEEFLNIQNL